MSKACMCVLRSAFGSISLSRMIPEVENDVRLLFFLFLILVIISKHYRKRPRCSTVQSRFSIIE